METEDTKTETFVTNRDLEEVYHYHSDHLGSASWITNGNGEAIQHLQYMPFGAPLVNQRAAGYSERFTFTGKERDEETGYGYFGARYMDHEILTSFLSVDRYASKYPSISPYAYCAWNPIRLTDPTGDTLVAKEIDSQRDIKRVAGEYGDRIHFDENGIADIDYSGMTEREIKEMKKHKGVALLADIIESDKKILYEATDILLITTLDGEKIAGTMANDNTGVVNLSRYGHDSNEGYSYMPQDGYDGQVIISVSGEWKDPRGFDARIEIVSHELAENYARTHLNRDYLGTESAHRYANSRMKNLHENYTYKSNYDPRKMSPANQEKMRKYMGF